MRFLLVAFALAGCAASPPPPPAKPPVSRPDLNGPRAVGYDLLDDRSYKFDRGPALRLARQVAELERTLAIFDDNPSEQRHLRGHIAFRSSAIAYHSGLAADHRSAALAFESLIGHHPDYCWNSGQQCRDVGHYYAAYHWLESAQPSRARDHLEKVIAFEPQSRFAAAAYYAIGLIRDEAGEADEAERAYRTALGQLEQPDTKQSLGDVIRDAAESKLVALD